MSAITVPKDRVNEFLNGIIGAGIRVVAPVKNENLLEFREIDSAEKVLFNDELPYKSPKEFLFPQTELFLKFHENGDVSEESRAQKTVIFGVRPCDLYALKVLEEVFTKGACSDALFMNHKNNTTLIGLGCLAEKPGCFCAERGVDKTSSPDCDIFLNDRGSWYEARILTGAGKGLADRFLPGWESAGAAGAKTSEETPEEMPESAPDETYPSENAPGIMPGEAPDVKLLEIEADERELFERIDWGKISETCLGCGTCTFVCGTCHCFAFQDVKEKGTVKRYRCWDSCMYPKFTVHASGHNPRPTKKERYRQRVLHKFLYVKQNFGLTACSGCGRCARSCPAGLNIRTVVKKIMEELS